jgi:hypothetical protein
MTSENSMNSSFYASLLNSNSKIKIVPTPKRTIPMPTTTDKSTQSDIPQPIKKIDIPQQQIINIRDDNNEKFSEYRLHKIIFMILFIQSFIGMVYLTALYHFIFAMYILIFICIISLRFIILLNKQNKTGEIYDFKIPPYDDNNILIYNTVSLIFLLIIISTHLIITLVNVIKKTNEL